MAEVTMPDLVPLTGDAFTREVLQGDPSVSFLILFESGSPDDALASDALAAAEMEHKPRVRAFRTRYADFAAEFARMRADRQDIDTFNLDRAPVVGLYRGGRLVTTWNPRRLFFIDKLQQREVHTQLAIFLRKMVFFDPGKVRDQVNLEVAEKKKSG